MTEQTRRATRLVRIRELLVKRGNVSCAELASELGYSQRTIQRDIAALESELGVPLEYEGRRWKLMPGAKLVFGPVRLTLQEARAVYFATRLMLRSADERDPDGVSALEKVADALPGGLAGHMRRTVVEYGRLPSNSAYIESLRRLTEAWAANHTATISYRSASHANARTTDIDPYLLDHTQSGTYVFGYSSEHREVRSFKVDRIPRRFSCRFPPPMSNTSPNSFAEVGGESSLERSTTKCRSTSQHPSRRASGRATGTRASSSTTSPAAEFACA